VQVEVWQSQFTLSALSRNIPPYSHYLMPCGLTARSRCWNRAPSLLLESKCFTEVSQSY
jgi:hypothetical protein